MDLPCPPVDSRVVLHQPRVSQDDISFSEVQHVEVLYGVPLVNS